MSREEEFSGRLLALAARRAADWPHMFAGIIASYLELNGLTEEELCSQLGCDGPTLDLLRLCSRPDPEPYAFSVDIERIAKKFGLDASSLAAIVREVDATDAFRASSQAQEDGQTPFLSTSGGMLKAARDRDHDQGGKQESDNPGEDITSRDEGE